MAFNKSRISFFTTGIVFVTIVCFGVLTGILCILIVCFGVLTDIVCVLIVYFSVLTVRSIFVLIVLFGRRTARFSVICLIY